MPHPGPILIVIGGLPGTGKTTLARLLAARIGAVHLRVDTIEQAIVRSGLAGHPVGPAGYTVGYALAGDHLRQGLSVIAESVNPLAVTRDAWRDVGIAAGVPAVEVEVACSDTAEHRRRIATRSSDIPGLPQPDWQQILDRDYRPWDREHVVVDTAGQEPQESLASLVRRLHA
ncbi:MULTISPECIES: AAA family ATPase [unclassified Streptomyces]|uniref:AAA family ATPase n=1 Tax=Streptomyces sp. DvalAA-19 TaxID=1839761 RepID=UPI00081B926D|nr:MULTISPECIES: AAA family ATPase [unclassified Streptomyces]RST10816.1 adenylyl-sulfate kinase [Streptomyces sp. WAC04770]SCD99296.1 Predicted kinase [Streptomyces sp. DvalAA-19]